MRINDTQRPKLEPSQVTKLGHLVLEAVDFATSVRWYIDTLGFIPSDVMCVPDGTPVGAFMRLDRGKDPTDHHTLFVAMGLESKVDHVAFEVVDLDAVEMGQQVMRAGRYRHAWGVGRHLLGSWRDPWEQKHEHYADGDLFDAAQPAGYHLMNREGLYQWGADLPDDFVDANDPAPPLERAETGAQGQGAPQADDGSEGVPFEARSSLAALITATASVVSHHHLARG